MRMTNKIMQNNSLYNINNNKMLQDKLSTQMSTLKKISRPSDDPVVAIRALRLRSDVSQITQYYGKNVPDAESWLKITGDALNTTSTVITSIIDQCLAGSNKDLDADALDIIVTQLKALKDEFYATGNVDSAGRYIFTGYRTDTTLTYTEDTTQNFGITEQLTLGAVDKINHTEFEALKGLSKDSYDPAVDGPISGNTVSTEDVYRIRLSYDNGSTTPPPTIKYVTDATAVPPTEADLIPSGSVQTISSTADPNPYEYIQAHPDEAVYIPETGELLIGNDLHDDMQTTMAADPNAEIRVTYHKDSWKKGDLRPQHYFACSDNTNAANPINYNFSKDNNNNDAPYISCEGEKQIIEYDVGYNQQIRINTTADEVFTMDVSRNIDDLENALLTLKQISKSKKNLDDMLKEMSPGEAGYANLQETCAAAGKAYNSVRENVQKMFEGLTTKMQGNLSNTNVAITDNGTRGSRLDLVSNRLMTQKTTFETLQSANEDVDVTEVTIQLTSMNNSYQSALMATAKIMQNSLMNYI